MPSSHVIQQVGINDVCNGPYFFLILGKPHFYLQQIHLKAKK